MFKKLTRLNKYNVLHKSTQDMTGKKMFKNVTLLPTQFPNISWNIKFWIISKEWIT